MANDTKLRYMLSETTRMREQKDSKKESDYQVIHCGHKLHLTNNSNL